MLKLIDIKKDYVTGDTTVSALRGVDLEFRKSEFVAILGHSGCGKTTLLNIIGGLDKYTSGDLIINGKSTKDFTDGDWDTYRNHSIGFVFQSYNLIPHQTVLSNVELALTLSGVSKEERKKRAIEALEKVGLGDQLHKRPNQMSGGQMQRVAIARALENNPDILMADEPTGALDSDTSVQIMEILKEISKDKLIIMVTHNPELADTYANRIIRLKDGEVEGDTNPYTATEAVESDMSVAVDDSTNAESSERKVRNEKKKKKSMSFFTAFLLSLNNLLTKKGRTILTAFAGSIGIIGIALIFAVSQGMTGYINHVQENTLSSYPLTLQSTTTDVSPLVEELMGVNGKDKIDVDRLDDAVYKDQVIADLVNALSRVETSENDLKSFKEYLESELSKEDSELKNAISAIQYTYNINLTIYTKNADGKIIKSDTNELMASMIADYMMKSAGNSSSSEGPSSSTNASSSMMASMMGMKLWQEMLPGLEKGEVISSTVKDQYDLIYGEWANDYNEIVLVVNENNELDDLTLYALGLLSEDDIDKIIDAASKGQTIDEGEKYWTFEEIVNKLSFKVILPADCYDKLGDIYVDMSETDDVFLGKLYDEAFELKVSGIIRLKDEVDSGMLASGIGYTHKLTEYVIEQSVSSEVVQAQLASPTIDVLTGLPFKSTNEGMTNAEKATALKAYIATLDDSARDVAKKAEIYVAIKVLDELNKSLVSNVEAELSKYTTDAHKAGIIAMMSEALAKQTGASVEEVSKYLNDMTLDQLKQLIRPSIEAQESAKIAGQVAGQYITMTDAEKASALDAELLTYTDDACAIYYDNAIEFSKSSYEDNLASFGNVDINTPHTINLYCETFEQKDQLKALIDDYNADMKSAGFEDKQISYSDLVGIMMSSITKIINAITYVLIAFVATSLVVSSIMIGVITLISVQERTKEIGILRAIGASKKDISRVFNAETMIVGFASGLLGILVTLVLVVLINIILYSLTGIGALKATLGFVPAVVLIVISMALTLIAGLVPSRIAANKDPVIALRTE
ncbi:MAG: ABC transporter ATP-binding protein/permease [Clostridia bacterium]|nr:ABC transporter ATP-binding protein/permease [Clostridia bacterium]